MAKLGKRLKAISATVEREKLYPLNEAVVLIKGAAKAKFNETVNIAINTCLDPKYADQVLRAMVTLPHGTGKTNNVLVFAKGPKAAEAQTAGADIVGAEELVEQINAGTIDINKIDRCIATPDLMGVVGRLGKVLGPRGLMPNPKLGTVTMNVSEAIKGAKGGSVEIRAEKAGIIHAGVGKASFTADQLADNIRALVDAMNKNKPAGAKGVYLRKLTLSSTMGPGVKVDINSVAA